MNTLIKDGWESYWREVIPVAASQVQIDETRKAFYAGALHLFHGLISRFDDTDQEPPEDDLKLMDDVHAELDRFIEEAAIVNRA